MVKCNINGQSYDIDGILFDKDGTLLEFNSLWVEWAKQLIDKVVSKTGLEEEVLSSAIGFNYQKDTWDPKGPLCIASRDDIITILSFVLYQNGMPWNEAVELVTDTYQQIDLNTNWNENIAPVLGLNTLLNNAHHYGIKLGVVTSDNYNQAVQHLKALDIESYFTSVIGHDQVERGKPFPDMVQKACEELGVTPKRTLIVGDSNGDMILGRKSDLLVCIGIVSKVDMSTDHLINADHIIRNYHAITIEDKERGFY